VAGTRLGREKYKSQSATGGPFDTAAKKQDYKGLFPAQTGKNRSVIKGRQGMGITRPLREIRGNGDLPIKGGETTNRKEEKSAGKSKKARCQPMVNAQVRGLNRIIG